MPTDKNHLNHRSLKSIVKLSNVDICQQDNSVILQNISLNIGEGEFTYLIGKTGSGKSSLLKTIYAALPLGTGHGEVAGFDLREISRNNIHLLRRKLGIVFQDFNLLTDRNVAENLLFVLRATGWTDEAEMNARMQEVLTEVGLLTKQNSMPYELSGGEQQRIVIARALLNKPMLLLADEPTGNLDPETSDDVLTLLRNLAKQHNTAVLCATHDYRILQNFPARIVRVQNGKLIDDEGITVRSPSSRDSSKRASFAAMRCSSRVADVFRCVVYGLKPEVKTSDLYVRLFSRKSAISPKDSRTAASFSRTASVRNFRFRLESANTLRREAVVALKRSRIQAADDICVLRNTRSLKTARLSPCKNRNWRSIFNLALMVKD